ncbi:MAG TPA: UDP-N-acetylmuramoyl-L-alanine--D-glutamate ligase [Coriobacteriia bacterium]|nr:UDP-N-acetylmuramoyl-L-alanine--D-glutamate ligase [Coriobacteriia bacterium]
MEEILKQNNIIASVDPRSVRSVCVLGSGVTGDAVADYFRSLPNPPTIDSYTDDAEVTKHYDLAVVSPGVPPHSRMVVSARRQVDELIGEPELAYRISPGRWIAITGTNGKTTTTALMAHVLNRAGVPARVAGKPGTTCIEAVRNRGEGEYIVAELSSYQLYYSKTLVPDAAVLLNITPDHIDWHGGYAAYRDAKLALLGRMHGNLPVVVDAVSDQTTDVIRSRVAAGDRVIALGSREGLCGDMTLSGPVSESAYLDAKTGKLTCVIEGKRHSVMSAADLKIKGIHNRQNALAVAAVALAMGLTPEKIAVGLAGFEALEHRIEFVAEIDGVGFYNDSKATNPEATCKALASFDNTPLVVMLGGRDKGTSLDELVQLAESTCKTVVCYGEAGPRFHAAFAEAGRSAEGLKSAGDFKAAFQTALDAAAVGDVVLLSPACASFDEFSSYEERGGYFKQLVTAERARSDFEKVS